MLNQLKLGLVMFLVCRDSVLSLDNNSIDNEIFIKDIPEAKALQLSKHRQKRQYNPSYDYPESVDYYVEYPSYDANHLGSGYEANALAPIGLAGGAGVALKALKVKKAVKGLKLLSVPLGLAMAGGIAALVSGAIPPAVIGGINLPFQGR